MRAGVTTVLVLWAVIVAGGAKSLSPPPQPPQDERLSKNFWLSEFRCHHCGRVLRDSVAKLVNSLQKARDIAGVPFPINSGYRCPEYNRQIGGVPNSAHTKGLAADVRTDNAVLRWRILRSLLYPGVEFPRIGVYPQFIHCDVDKSLPQTVIWVGGGKDL